MTNATPVRHKKQANVTLTPGIYEKLEERHKMKPKNCPMCHQVVGATFNLCPYCGYSLTIEQAMSEDEMEMEADDEVVKLLASDPRLMEVLKRALKKL